MSSIKNTSFWINCQTFVLSLKGDRTERIGASPVETPAMDSFTLPVSGDLPPIESRSQEESRWPNIKPGAKMSLFCGLSESQVGGTSRYVE